MSRLASNGKFAPEQLLAERYQAVEVLSNEKWGQTYIALDTHQPHHPKCLIKQLRPWVNDGSGLSAARDLFQREVEILEVLGQHGQIPQLLDCLEFEQTFYIVREFIPGHSLSAELSPESPWSEGQVVQFLLEVLNILAFVHEQGVIHGNLQPSNLIRRVQDGKLVLTDFSTIKQIQTPLVGIRFSANAALYASGYIPMELALGQPYLSSDIYSLGTIAIQALTGLNPKQLLKDPETGEVVWQQQVRVNPTLADILSQMVRYSWEGRYQDAFEVIKALKFLVGTHPEMEEECQILSIKKEESQNPEENGHSSEVDGDSLPSTVIETTQVETPTTSPNSPASKTFQSKHMKAAGVTTSLALALGASGYLILKGTNSVGQPDPGSVALEQASQKYQSGELQEALGLAKSVSPESQAYPEAQSAIDQWQKDWQKAQAQEAAIKKAFAQQQWRDVLAKARQLPDVDFWQKRVEPMVQQATAKLEKEAYQLLQQAYEQAVAKDFAGALNTFKQIPQETKAYALVEEKTAEYDQKLKIRANYLLQQAYNRAAARDFTGALEHLQKIPKGTPSYAIAQQKIAEYTQKQNIKANHLLQQAYDRAAVKDFAGAIGYLKQISQNTPTFAKAQEKLAEYTNNLRRKGAV